VTDPLVRFTLVRVVRAQFEQRALSARHGSAVVRRPEGHIIETRQHRDKGATRLAMIAMVAVLCVTACAPASHTPEPATGLRSSGAATPIRTPDESATAAAPGQTETETTPSETPADPGVSRVVAISIDGLNSRAITTLGSAGTPAFHRLMQEGAYTLNARTAHEQTRTLPNHTGMLTGRRIDSRNGGHGVTYNTDNGRRTVHDSAGEYVSSVFDVVHDRGGGTALFTTKEKFALFQRTWNTDGGSDHVGIDNGRAKIDEFVVDTNDDRLVAMTNTYLRSRPGQFVFLHVSLPDESGHEDGFMSEGYLAAVTSTDRLLSTVLDAISSQPVVRRETVVLLTADHGGAGDSHSNPTRLDNYRIPFIAWGPGVPAGRNLYSLNPTRRSPGDARTTYEGPQPIRNGDLANLAAHVLDVPAVPDSQFDANGELTVFQT
jgi:hypothetical protein